MPEKYAIALNRKHATIREIAAHLGREDIVNDPDPIHDNYIKGELGKLCWRALRDKFGVFPKAHYKARGITVKMLPQE